MKSYLLVISFVCFLFPQKSKSQVAFSQSIGKYKDMAQLEELYKDYGSLLIINNFIFQIPCECSPCRNLGGGSDDRNLGGSSDDRNLGGDSDDRNLGGDSDERNLGGGSDDRNLGGNSDERNLGGSSDDRNLGGNSDDRNLGGDSDERNLGGGSDDRNLGGNSDDRKLGGGSDDRNLGGDSDDRDMKGQITQFSCKKTSKTKNEFTLLGINPNSTVKIFNGVDIKEVKADKVKL